MEEAIIKASEPETVSGIPDIGLIRNERKYQIETINKSKGEPWLYAGLYTKKDALEIFKKKKKQNSSIRVWHMGETETGVPMKMIDVSYRWDLKYRK